MSIGSRSLAGVMYLAFNVETGGWHTSIQGFSSGYTVGNSHWLLNYSRKSHREYHILLAGCIPRHPLSTQFTTSCQDV